MSLKLGIGIDGVLTQYYKFIVDRGVKFFNKHPINFTAANVSELFNKTKEEEAAFWDKYFLEYLLFAEPRKGFTEFVLELELLNVDYVFITNRRPYGVVTEPILHKLTQHYVSSWTGCPAKIIFNTGSKRKACFLSDVSLFIESRTEIIEDLANDMKVIRFSEPYNNNCITHPNICVATDFNQVQNIVKKEITELYK